LNGSFDSKPSAFHPTDELRRTDADLLIFFLSAQPIQYASPVEDYWYSAHQPTSSILSREGEEIIAYKSDEAASPLACTVQYQACVPTLSTGQQCTPLAGWGDFGRHLVGPPNIRQNAKMVIKHSDFGLYSFNAFVGSLGPNMLPSNSRLYQALQFTFPDDKWQQDVQLRANMTLASL